MHLEKLIIINRAPFENLQIDFEKEGINVLSGINGRGKTTILSHIADAFYELAKIGFPNEFEGKENKYYRVSSGLHVLNNKNPSLIYLRFSDNKETIDYLDARNSCSQEQYNKLITLENKIPYKDIETSFKNENNFKYIHKYDSDKIENIFDNNILTYFPSYRYEQPNYLNNDYAIKLSFTKNSFLPVI